MVSEIKGSQPDPTQDNVRVSDATLRRRRRVSWVLFVASLVACVLVGMLIVSIMERRWETERPQIAVVEVDEWETSSEVWGSNYPREFDTFKQTATENTRTTYGGSYPRDYLEEDPRQVVLFAGYGFSKDYKQARGHAFAVKDVKATRRTTRADGTDTGMPGTCWTCKSPQVPKLMNEMGTEAFYNSSWKELSGSIHEAIGCLDCHDPKTMDLRISRPALREAFARQGRDIDSVSHQEMRSLVCAQCHVEYYFGNNPGDNGGETTFAHKGKYLVHPWDEGTSVESMERYYEKRPEFYDWIHPISGTRMIKMQHPDWEMYSTGVHAYRGVACADCHMPYRTEGGVKFTNHFIQSPLLDVSNSCGVCHRWSEEEILNRVVSIQGKEAEFKLLVEDALVYAHFDVAACSEAGASDEELASLRDIMWRAQMRWDYVSANNGMGFHSPQESMRILGMSLDLAQQIRIESARVLARQGFQDAPVYPDWSSREKAMAVITGFEEAASNSNVAPPSLLRKRD